MTIVGKSGTREISDGDPVAQAYRALETAAYRIGRNNAEAYLREKKRRGSYFITPEHREIVEAMPKVLDGRLDPESAMALLGQYDIQKQRFGKR